MLCSTARAGHGWVKAKRTPFTRPTSTVARWVSCEERWAVGGTHRSSAIYLLTRALGESMAVALAVGRSSGDAFARSLRRLVRETAVLASHTRIHGPGHRFSAGTTCYVGSTAIRHHCPTIGGVTCSLVHMALSPCRTPEACWRSWCIPSCGVARMACTARDIEQPPNGHLQALDDSPAPLSAADLTPTSAVTDGPHSSQSPTSEKATPRSDA